MCVVEKQEQHVEILVVPLRERSAGIEADEMRQRAGFSAVHIGEVM
jgi:hypothetical protein